MAVRLAPVLAGALLFGLLWGRFGSPAHLVECLALEQATTPWLDTSHLFSCSNVRQAVMPELSQNVKRMPSDVPGWDMWVAEESSMPGVLAVKFVKDRPRMIFYPRMSGTDSGVGVFEGHKDGPMKRLASVTGADKSWTEIGKQCAVNVSCVEHGHLDKEFDVIVYFVLTGPWSQLWTNNQSILF